MKVISIVNIKGGVGKTVSSVNLAACLGEKKKKTLIIDMDAQSNATQYLNAYNTKYSTYDVLMGNVKIESAIVATNIPNVDILPGNIKLILCENEILNDTRKSRENRLKKAIQCLDNYDFVIIDCPPSLGIITTNVLVAANYVLVPIKIDKFALDGFEYLLNAIDEIKDEFNSPLQFLGTFITMDKRTSVNKQIKKELKDALHEKVLNTTIRENAKVVQSTFDQVPVVLLDKNAISSKDYRNLTEEVLKYVE